MKETRAMEKLVNSLDELLSRMKEQKRQLDLQIAELQRDSYRVIPIYPKKDDQSDTGIYERE